jgi:hypothetical protein
LGFGVKDFITGEVSDLIITDNNDSLKVLSTVAFTVLQFTDKYPNAWVLATGSTKARTRLYRMGIANNYEDIVKEFYVFGLFQDEWSEFRKGTE